jgi:1-deoxy-D-xylulose 5-phosphate reductoisomerase
MEGRGKKRRQAAATWTAALAAKRSLVAGGRRFVVTLNGDIDVVPVDLKGRDLERWLQEQATFRK